jgi:excisionase family DNA binding protein
MSISKSLQGICTHFVYTLARRGELPTVRVGERYVRFRAEAITQWTADQESTTPRYSR